ncbi:MAG: hypothetical protein NTX75_01605, partial [Proteobacteria bacterium]|nr:hypothetical protein [Pseudomonadota bacterium]
MKKTGKKVKDERSKGRGSAPASGGYPKVKSCSILLAMAMIFMLSVSLPAYATDATGGTITYDGNYKIHTFTGSGTLNVTESGNVEYLVVAGGGGGNNSNDLYSGGGGGAGGGVLSGTLAVSTGNLAVTVGDGGLTKSNGYNSVFSSITATGGVKGVYNTSNGAGANGNASTISGTSAYYAGGGGGGKSYYDNTPYPGGLGGGGRGGYQSQNGGWGTANTGGGGGGSSNQGSPGYGGSGIVIVRYEIQRFTITASSGDNGSISSTGATTVDFGASQSYVITPANSYRIVDVLIDGSSAGTGGAYTFTNVSANHTISATFDIGVNAYSITASAGANGTISPAGVTTKNQSASQTYFITPNSGYKISSVLIDGISVGTMAAYTFSNLNANHAISAVFAEKTYTFATGGTVTYDGNYKIHTFTDSGTLNVTQNGDAEYLVVAGGGAGGGSNASGGGGAGGFLNGMSSLSIGSKTVTVGSGGISSALTQGTNGSNSVFNSITAIGGGGGGINGGATRGSNGGSGGGTGNNTSAPPLGIGNELITGTGVPGQGYAGGEGSFGYSHGSGGGGAASAAFGSSPNHCEGCTVKINGGTGQVSSISGVSTYYAGGGGGGAACIYNDSGIGGLGGGGRGGYYGSSISAGISGSANTGGGGGGGGWGGGWTVALSALGGAGGSGIVIVRYELEHIAILSSFGANGSISPPGATTVISGASQSYTITPDNSYQISDVLVDGVSVGAVNTYTFSNVTANHTISATFITVTYTLTASSGANGSVSPTGVTRVTQGASQNYTITPAAGFLVADVLVDGVSVGAVSAYTFSDVSATHTISATFTTATYTLTASSGANGSITPSGVTPLNYGASQAYTIIPATGYKVADVFVDGSSVGAVTSYNFSNITANHTISVTFTEKTYVVATGGTVTYSGNYKMHTFTGSGTLTVTRGGDAEYLVVGGGGRGMGGGGSGSGYTYGGGGGGGVMQGSLSISIGNISVTVGAGENSSAFSSITAPPGGNGRTGSDRDCGGSGGASGAPQNNPGGILLPGSSGMTWYPYCSLQSGGGGGAGGAGSNTSGLDWQVKGHGGPGIATAISGTPVYYGAGGGGGASGWGAMGGIGGGGNETKNGTPNTGGGGGGRYNFGTPGYGGSGIVIVRYEVQSFTITASSGENGSITPSGVTTVNQGASQSYTITPATGYKVTDVLVDGVSVGAVNTYNFTDVSATHTISATFGVATHTITASSGTNGLVSPTGVTSVNQGASQSYTITPSEGYQVEDVLIDGSSVGVVTAYAFDNVVASHTISATFKVATYTIISSAGENGAISPSGPTSVTHGASRAYTITPATGYSVTDVLVDGVSVGAVSTYAFTNVSVNHTISAAFGINTYTIAASFGENGAISPSGSTSVTHGGSQNYTITPAANYSIVDVLVDGVSVGAVSTYEFTNVTAPHTISATFSINTYAIISSAGANGSITPSGSTSVTHGGSQAYTITPATNYSIVDILVDGASVGFPLFSVSTYEFTNVSANHTISATFDIATHTITASAGENGSITPSGAITVNQGTSQNYAITPSTGYQVADVLVDGVSVGAVSTYTFNNVAVSHTISATFDIITYTITASSGTNGSVSPTGVTSVTHGASLTYIVTPAANYSIADVLVDGVSVGAVSIYEFTDITVNHTISATFGINTYTITASSGENGSISPTGVASADYGASRHYTITPATNYSITDVLVDGSSVGAVSTYTFTNVSANHTISAAFDIVTHTITASAGENGSITPSGAITVNQGTSQNYAITPSTGYQVA